jgi:hypothetical protein
LLGNVKDGFKSLSTAKEKQLFTFITIFNNKVYLGSNLDPLVYDPVRLGDGILPLKTTLKPVLKNVNYVDAKNGVLWAIGNRDLARFNGTEW